MLTEKTKHIPIDEFQRGLRFVILEGVLATAFMGTTGAMVGGVFLINFILKLNASPLQIAVLAAIPQLANITQLLSPYLIEKTGARKGFCITTAIVQKLLWFMIISIPFLISVDKSNLQICTIFIVLFISSVFGAASSTAYLSWMSDLVHPSMRGRFFGRRNIYANMVMMTLPILVGKFLDVHGNFEGYALIFGTFTIVGLAGTWFLSRVPNIRMEKEESITLSSILTEPFKDVTFRKFLCSIIALTFGTAILGPYIPVYMLETLKMSKYMIGVYIALFSLISMIFTWVWGDLADRFGHRSVATVCVLGTSFIPIMWSMTNTENYNLILPITYIVAGMTWPGVNLSILNLLMGLAPQRGMSKFISSFTSMVGIFGVIAPITGGLIITRLCNLQYTFMNLPINNYFVLFIVSAILRFIAFSMLTSVKIKGEVSAPALIRQFRYTNPFMVFVNLFLFSHSLSEARRLKLTRVLGKTKSPAAVDKLIPLLQDPSSQIREEAVKALGEIADEKAIMPLIEKLKDYPDIQRQAIWSLARIGSPQSLHPLIESLYHPDRQIRADAASALGEIRRWEAADSLMDSLRKEDEPLVFSASSKALSKIGCMNAIWEILPLLRKSQAPIVQQELAISMGNLLGHYGEFYNFIEGEKKIPGSQIIRMFERLNKLLKRRMEMFRLFEKGTTAYAWKRVEDVNEGRFDEVITSLDLLCQKLVYIFLQQLSIKYKWSKQFTEYISFSDYTRQIEELIVIDYYLGVNLWFICNLAFERKSTPPVKPRWIETMLAFYSLGIVAEGIKRLLK